MTLLFLLVGLYFRLEEAEGRWRAGEEPVSRCSFPMRLR